MAADATDERTPLLNGSTTGHRNGTVTDSNGNENGSGTVGDYDATDAKKKVSWATRVFGSPNTIKVLLAGFIITFAFSFTQVPIFYVFHLMECDVYYETHPPHTGPGDRCSLNEIAAGTATQFSILGMSTTFCGTVNLFVTGWSIKKWGPRFALILQTFIPAIRVATQVIGVLAGGNAGITIIQTTQLITIFGGPAGYILVVNTIAGELVEPMQRTAVFGQLQACIMLGQAISYLLGGMVGDAFGIRMPFQVAFVLFLFATLYSRTVIPYISPESLSDGKKTKAKGIKGFLAPLKILAPQRIRFMDGHVANHFGVFFLCCGIFLAVLATSYGPLLIQMYATAYFDFSQADNGWLMSGNALCRSIFLFFAFPKIIDAGRKWWVRKVEGPRPDPAQAKDPNALSRIPSRPEELEAPMWSGNQMSQEESMPQPETRPEDERTASHFDLFFLRWSLLLDGIMTGAAAFCTKSWHIYLGMLSSVSLLRIVTQSKHLITDCCPLASFLLPLGSGSAPAAKGVITEMCSHGDRTDALNAVTLVENIARLATQGLFGFIFSALAEAGKAHMTFHVNAALAIVGMAVLYLSHFPPASATILEEPENADGEESAEDDSPNLARVTSHETDR